MKALKKILDPKKLSTLLFYSSILSFIIAFNFSHNPAGGWYQQFMPDLGRAFITDMTFTDSLTGYAVTKRDTGNISYILKTSNGGDNWSIIKNDTREFTKVQFLNNDTGYAGTFYGKGGSKLYKTINGGLNWTTLNNPSADFEYWDFSLLNTDTIWATNKGVFGGGIYKTTNGGQSWINQYYVFGNNPPKIYMFNYDMGFMYNQNYNLFKTTNSGENWYSVPGGAFTDIHFIDTLTGWKAYGNMKKTTDGGLSWVTQTLPVPQIGTVVSNEISDFDFLNKDTIWGVGARIFYNGAGFRGFIYKSTNGGLTWGYQLPDTSYRFPSFDKIEFVTDSIGWAYSSINRGIHTVTSGDSTLLVGINNGNINIPINFILLQNYPNPFNPSTLIRFELKTANYVKIKIYNSLGNEIKTLVNEKQNAGKYEIEFKANDLPSGIYFYSLFINNERVDTKKMILIR